MGADELIAGLRLLVRRLQADGLNVILGTQTPSKDTAIGFGPCCRARRRRSPRATGSTTGFARVASRMRWWTSMPHCETRPTPTACDPSTTAVTTSTRALPATRRWRLRCRWSSCAARLRAPDRADGQPAAPARGTSTRFRFRAMERHGGRLPLGGSRSALTASGRVRRETGGPSSGRGRAGPGAASRRRFGDASLGTRNRPRDRFRRAEVRREMGRMIVERWLQARTSAARHHPARGTVRRLRTSAPEGAAPLRYRDGVFSSVGVQSGLAYGARPIFRATR